MFLDLPAESIQTLLRAPDRGWLLIAQSRTEGNELGEQSSMDFPDSAGAKHAFS